MKHPTPKPLSSDRTPSVVAFPPVESALQEPNGLLAVGGALTPEWLLAAYQRGIFPWFSDDREPILWWSPDPRAVLEPGALRVSRSLRKRLRTAGFRYSLDQAFDDVVAACAGPRPTGPGTWITPRMRSAYGRLHRLGYAHSVEVWLDGRLVGGVYGVSLGTVFFGESMFHRERDASKAALYTLVRQVERWDFILIDCQVMNPHLESLGATEIDRRTFVARLQQNDLARTRCGTWVLDDDLRGTIREG
jgi:leucyl/phenylalanyl-tRNA---protein transferase